MWSRLETWRIWVGIAVRANRWFGVASARGSVLGQSAEKVCGVSAEAAGVKLGASLVDRRHVNMGTATALRRAPRPVVAGWIGAVPVDGFVVGRSRRSTSRTGKPSAWGRAAANRVGKSG